MYYSVWYLDFEDKQPVPLRGGLKLREAAALADKAREHFDPSLYVWVQQ